MIIIIIIIGAKKTRLFVRKFSIYLISSSVANENSINGSKLKTVVWECGVR